TAPRLVPGPVPDNSPISSDVPEVAPTAGGYSDFIIALALSAGVCVLFVGLIYIM
uniref:Uncharacterized protein n=1 Tax=Trichobilharzia regenti TaxID=157069 RepID=A0AA85J2Z3_TRIRE